MTISTAKANAVSTSFTRLLRTEIRNTMPLYPTLCTQVPSNSNLEDYNWLGDIPGMQELLGDRIFESLRAMNWQIVNKSWGQSVGLEIDVVDDDRYGLYTPAVQRMGRKAVRHPDILLSQLIVNGESSVCYDGQFFFDTDHAEGDSGTQSNMRTHTVVSTSDVTVEEFRDSFHAALKRMFSFKTDQGDFWVEPEAVGLEDLVIAVPLALWEVALRAMSQLVSQEGTTGAGVTNVLLRSAKVCPIIRMGSEASGSDVKWDLYHVGDIIRPFIFQDRSALRVEVEGANDIEKNYMKLMSKARYQLGYGMWQCGVRTTFST